MLARWQSGLDCDKDGNAYSPRVKSAGGEAGSGQHRSEGLKVMPLSPMELEESWRLIDLAETDNFAVLVSLAGLNKTRHMENASPLPKRTISFCVLRGGSWHRNPQYLRSACREWVRLDAQNDGVGLPCHQNVLTSCLFNSAGLGNNRGNDPNRSSDGPLRLFFSPPHQVQCLECAQTTLCPLEAQMPSSENFQGFFSYAESTQRLIRNSSTHLPNNL